MVSNEAHLESDNNSFNPFVLFVNSFPRYCLTKNTNKLQSTAYKLNSSHAVHLLWKETVWILSI